MLTIGILQGFPPANVTHPTQEQQTLTAIDVATGANPEGGSWLARWLGNNARSVRFHLFMIYGGVGS
jgi:hypothetical protein